MRAGIAITALLGASACEGSVTQAPPGADTEGTEGGSDTGTGGEPDRLLITHEFGGLALPPFEDNAERCVSWTLHNEQPLYIQSVVLSNLGAFHHSNWFVVPETAFEGPDGYWRCSDRGYSELDAAGLGTVLFAQSTQSFTEEQRLSDGAVVKVPARHKVVAGVHTLNLAPRDAWTNLWLSLEPIHPVDVAAVVSPASLQYRDLAIPAATRARYTARCDLAAALRAVTSDPLALRVHYILPHYHYLGDYFDVTVIGGELDGQSIYRLDGFNAEANGLTFDPPLDLPGATGLSMTCGYNNWRDVPVDWGNGDGEMCVMLALVEADAMLGGSVGVGSKIVGVEDDIQMFEGSCFPIATPKKPDQGMPSSEELTAPLYLPPTDPDAPPIPPIPTCYDTDPVAAAEAPATLTSMRDSVFTPACTFSACHGTAAVAGLDLSAPDLHRRLLEHPVRPDAGMPLVTPGDPERSWLYHLLSYCEPQLPAGGVVPHMPLNAPILLDPGLVAKVRDWIAAGARDD